MTNPLRIADVADGKVYEVEKLHFRTTHLFMEVAFSGDLVYKRPSSVGWEDFRRFVELAERDREMIRPLESLERASNGAELFSKYPAISNLGQACEASWVRWLLIHRLQYDRIVNNNIVCVPQSRFVIVNAKKRFFGSQRDPAIVQERIHGTSIWDMRDHANGCWRSEWSDALREIGDRLIVLLESSLRNHINWNIANFVLSKVGGELYYVDCTPSVVLARAENEQNISCILRDFS